MKCSLMRYFKGFDYLNKLDMISLVRRLSNDNLTTGIPYLRINICSRHLIGHKDNYRVYLIEFLFKNYPLIHFRAVRAASL